jgi:hypothetical protein
MVLVSYSLVLPDAAPADSPDFEGLGVLVSDFLGLVGFEPESPEPLDSAGRLSVT